MIYIVTLYYNGILKSTVNDLPYRITTEIDTAIDIANGKLANPVIYGDIRATGVSITAWEGTETTEYVYKQIDVSDYVAHNATFSKGKRGLCVNIPAQKGNAMSRREFLENIANLDVESETELALLYANTTKNGKENANEVEV